jgi:hypothetical protein
MAAVNKVGVTTQDAPLSGIAMNLLRGSRNPAQVGCAMCVAIMLQGIAAAAAVEEEGDNDKEIPVGVVDAEVLDERDCRSFE